MSVVCAHIILAVFSDGLS